MASHLRYKSPDGLVVRVKVGFSWQAFLIGSWKSMIRRAWPVFLLVAGYFAFLHTGPPIYASPRLVALKLFLLIVYFAYMVFCGLFGNRWLMQSLRRRGFKLLGEERD
ncbi:MAG: hypothetical protein ABIV63_06975 [Caldimonas sp.]